MEKTIIKAKITFFEPILGTSPANGDIYREYIGSKSPDATTIEDEVEALGVDAVAEKGMTVFPRTKEGKPFLYDYQIKGFFKDTCGGLRKVKGSYSEKIKAYKKEIDKLIFPKPREIVFEGFEKMGECQRPLRAQTAQGERISLAISEEIPAGATVTFSVECLTPDLASLFANGLITVSFRELVSGETAARVGLPGRRSPNKRRRSWAKCCKAKEWHRNDFRCKGIALHRTRRIDKPRRSRALSGNAREWR